MTLTTREPAAIRRQQRRAWRERWQWRTAGWFVRVARALTANTEGGRFRRMFGKELALIYEAPNGQLLVTRNWRRVDDTTGDLSVFVQVVEYDRIASTVLHAGQVRSLVQGLTLWLDAPEDVNGQLLLLPDER